MPRPPDPDGDAPLPEGPGLAVGLAAALAWFAGFVILILATAP